jgi:hypothetical protein
MLAPPERERRVSGLTPPSPRTSSCCSCETPARRRLPKDVDFAGGLPARNSAYETSLRAGSPLTIVAWHEMPAVIVAHDVAATA